MYLLDTNVISELRHGKPKQSIEVRTWAATESLSRFYLSVITLLELEKGIQSLERRTPPEGSAIRGWFDGVRSKFAGRILPFTEHAAMICASFDKQNRDAMIAATAVEHGFTVVTRNAKDFKELRGVTLLNPWEP